MAKKSKPADNLDLTAPVVTPMTPEEIGIELGVPVSQKDQPDLLNYQPRRFIQLEEAKRRGLSWFFDGRACRYSHVAAHRTSNEHICSDCQRIKKGLEPIYGKSKAQKFYDMKPVADSNTASAAAATPAPKSLGLSAGDNKFLECYARERSLEKATAAAGTTKELILARRVGFPGLDEAMSKLETSLDIPRYLPPGAHFTWDDEKRRIFIDHYINSGEIDLARQAVGCTRAQFFAEQKANTQFSNEVESARPLAESVVEEAFIRAAKQGQQSILPKYMEILEKRWAERPVSDPTKGRAELQKMLDEMRARFDRERGWRVIATGALLPRPQLEKVFLYRDVKTGVTYTPAEVEDVTVLLLNMQQNAAAQAAAAPPGDVEVDENDNTVSNARDDDSLTGDLT